MYEVELGFILISKYIKSCFNTPFEKHLSFFFKHNLSQLKTWNYGNILDLFIININVYLIMYILLYINIMFYFI